MAKKKEPVHPVAIRDGHIINYAFTSGGEPYFYIKDVGETFCHRALEAIDVYDQWNMRCSKEYLQAHCQAMDEATIKQLNIPEIVMLHQNMKERMGFIVPTADIIWKFASVAYFDSKENPYEYKESYAKEKIDRWKQNGDVNTIFFLSCIRNLIPLPDTSKIDLATYLKVQGLVGEKHLERLLSVKSLSEQKTAIFTELNYQKSLIKTLPIAQS